jgi:hypothetical protein
MTTTNDAPLHLEAVHQDDALLDMLGGAEPIPGGTDTELVRVLLAWQRDTFDATNLPQPPE